MTLSSSPKKNEACVDETMKDESISDNVPLPYKLASTKSSKKEKLINEPKKANK